MSASHSTVSDHELVEKSQAGNLAAFEELVRRHERFVFGVSMRIVKNRSVAEDVAQETFFAAWKGIHGFRGDAQVRSWLYRIASNRALNAVTRQREFASEVEVIDRATPGSAEDAAIVRAGETAVTKAVHALPDNLRQVYELRERSQLSYEQIAEELGIPLNTVRTRLRRARSEVADQLKAWR